MAITLRTLALPPASRAKWLTKKEQRALINYLGGPEDEEDPDRSDEDKEAGSWKGGLAGEERFDLAFWLTLLRADVFGTVQASIVARLRKRVEAEVAIARAVEQVDDAAYMGLAAAYSDLRQQLYLESLAALALLMEVGVPQLIVATLIGLGAAHSAFAEGSAPQLLDNSAIGARMSATQSGQKVLLRAVSNSIRGDT